MKKIPLTWQLTMLYACVVCITDPPPPQPVDCEDAKPVTPSGIGGILGVKCGVDLDITDSIALEAARDNGDLFWLFAPDYIKGAVPTSEPITVTTGGTQKKVTIAHKKTATITFEGAFIEQYEHDAFDWLQKNAVGYQWYFLDSSLTLSWQAQNPEGMSFDRVYEGGEVNTEVNRFKAVWEWKQSPYATTKPIINVPTITDILAPLPL